MVLARPAGFEPATRCLEGSCSVRLSYGRSNVIVYGEDHATATRRSQCVSALKAAPPRKTLAASPEDSQPQRVPHPGLFVEFVQADQLNRRVARGPIGQLRVEMRPTVTSESRLLRVVSLHGEQVAGPAQALEVTGIHDLVPLGFAERQHPARAPWLVWCEDGHVDLDLVAPERIGHHTGRDLTRHRAEHLIPTTAPTPGRRPRSADRPPGTGT